MHISKSPQRRSVPVSLSYRASLWLLWAFFTAWSGMNVGAGVVALGLFGDRHAYLNYAFAFFLQFFASVAWLRVSIFFHDPGVDRLRLSSLIVPAALVIMTSIGVTYFEAKHAVLYVVKNSMALDMKSVEVKELQGLHAMVGAIAAQATDVYVQKVSASRELAEMSQDGNDGSNIAECGSICKKHWENFRQMKEQYPDLAVPFPQPAAYGSDVRSLFNGLLQRAALLEGRMKRLEQFLGQHAAGSAMPAQLTSAYESMAKALSKKEGTYGDELELDEKSLAMRATDDVFDQIWTGEMPKRIYRWAMLYAIMPFLIVICCSMLLARAATFNAGIDPVQELKKEVEEEEKASQELEKLAELKKKSWSAWLNTRFFDRKSRNATLGDLA